jgi:hypothetical protein
MFEIDPMAEVILGSATLDEDDSLDVDPPHPFEKFLAGVQLASELGGMPATRSARAERFEQNTSHIDAAFSRLSPPSTRVNWGPALAKSADNLDSEIIDDSHLLEKAGSRRKRSLTEWVRGELALGKTVRELAEIGRASCRERV